MAFEVIAMAPTEFETWLAASARPAAQPPDAESMRGRGVVPVRGLRRLPCDPRHAGDRTRSGPTSRRSASGVYIAAATLLRRGRIIAAFIVNGPAHQARQRDAARSASSRRMSSLRSPPISLAQMSPKPTAAARERLSEPAAAAEGRARPARGGLESAAGLAHPDRRQQHLSSASSTSPRRCCSSFSPAFWRC